MACSSQHELTRIHDRGSKSTGSWRIADGKEIEKRFTNYRSVGAQLEAIAADGRWVEEVVPFEPATQAKALAAIAERRAGRAELRLVMVG
jgi:hypothetical protein